MKRLLLALVLMGSSVFAHAADIVSAEAGDQNQMAPINSPTVSELQDSEGSAPLHGKLSWTCGLAFTGASGGIKIILGKFKTVATGTLSCVDLEGNHFTRGVLVTMGSYFLGPVVGIGYFKFAGVSSHISLFNCPPDVMFGDYLVVHGQGAFGVGGGAFTAVRIHPPEIAVNVSVKLEYGIGFQGGVEGMTISPL